VVHVGDLSSPPYACTDELVARRFAQFLHLENLSSSSMATAISSELTSRSPRGFRARPSVRRSKTSPGSRLSAHPTIIGSRSASIRTTQMCSSSGKGSLQPTSSGVSEALLAQGDR
jgi:hypothetical protein